MIKLERQEISAQALVFLATSKSRSQLRASRSTIKNHARTMSKVRKKTDAARRHQSQFLHQLGSRQPSSRTFSRKVLIHFNRLQVIGKILLHKVQKPFFKVPAVLVCEHESSAVKVIKFF